MQQIGGTPMKCRYCGSIDSRVVDSRPSDDGLSIRRRRECNACGHRFTTFERIEENPIMVVKRDGRREPFDREKLPPVSGKLVKNVRFLQMSRISF